MGDIGQSRLRDAMAPLPSIWAISPQGVPKKIPYALNVNGGIVKFEDGEVALRKGAEKKGWKLMEPECSEKEWAVWTAYHQKADEVGGRIAPLPKEHWPKCVRDAAEGGGPPVAEFDAKAVGELAGKPKGSSASKGTGATTG